MDDEEPCDLTADERESAAQEERITAKLARLVDMLTLLEVAGFGHALDPNDIVEWLERRRIEP